MKEEIELNNDNENIIETEKEKFIELTEFDSSKDMHIQDECVNPFPDEFDAVDVVNRTNISDFIFEDLQKNEQERLEEEQKNRTEPFYISKKELDYLIAENPRLPIYKRDEEGNLVHLEAESDDFFMNNFAQELKGIDDNELIQIDVPVGKKEINETVEQPAEDDGYYHHQNDYDDDNYYISEEEAEELHKNEQMKTAIKAVQDVINELPEDEKYTNPDDLFRDFLQNNFKDYLLAKKISGKGDNKYADKILPKEKIKENNEKIEVADFHNKRLSNHQKTSVIINRNEYSEINSIEVFCKCGEKTIIRFQEQDFLPTINSEQKNIEINSNTDIVVDTVEIAPIYNEEETEELIKYENEIADQDLKN